MWLCGTALRRALLVLPVAAVAVVAASGALLFGEVSLAPAATLFDTLVHRASQEVDTARLAVGCLETTVC